MENDMGSVASSVPFSCENRPDLALVVKTWDHLPDAIKAGILAMVKSAGGKGIQAVESTPAGS